MAEAAASKEEEVENVIQLPMGMCLCIQVQRSVLIFLAILERHTQAWTHFAYGKVERMSGVSTIHLF